MDKFVSVRISPRSQLELRRFWSDTCFVRPQTQKEMKTKFRGERNSNTVHERKRSKPMHVTSHKTLQITSANCDRRGHVKAMCLALGGGVHFPFEVHRCDGGWRQSSDRSRACAVPIAGSSRSWKSFPRRTTQISQSVLHHWSSSMRETSTCAEFTNRSTARRWNSRSNWAQIDMIVCEVGNLKQEPNLLSVGSKRSQHSRHCAFCTFAVSSR